MMGQVICLFYAKYVISSVMFGMSIAKERKHSGYHSVAYVLCD